MTTDNLDTVRPRRSVLYMPGTNQRAIEKARTLPADVIILDLEDAVAPEAKEAAREQVVAAATAGGFGDREVVIRVNTLDTAWGEADAAAVAQSGADAILIPKVETAATLDQLHSILRAANAPDELSVWIMTESPRGVLDLDGILASHPYVEVVIMGTSDLAKDMRVSPLGNREGLQYLLAHCVLTARAHRIDIIDGVHLALDDFVGYEQACEQGRILGFDGKSLIHPRQIEVANLHFGVSDADADAAREIVAAWESARDQRQGLTVVRGQLIEQLHVDEALRTLEIFAAARQRDAR